MFTQRFHSGLLIFKTSPLYKYKPSPWPIKKMQSSWRTEKLQHSKHIYGVNWVDPLFSLSLLLPSLKPSADALCEQSPWRRSYWDCTWFDISLSSASPEAARRHSSWHRQLIKYLTGCRGSRSREVMHIEELGFFFFAPKQASTVSQVCFN